MKNEIISKVQELNSIIDKTPEFQKYLLIKKKMEKNKKLCTLLNEVRVLQKDVVHHLEKKDELARKMNELLDYPLYREYQNTLSEINNYYAIIETMINNYFDDVFN